MLNAAFERARKSAASLPSGGGPLNTEVINWSAPGESSAPP